MRGFRDFSSDGSSFGVELCSAEVTILDLLTEHGPQPHGIFQRKLFSLSELEGRVNSLLNV